MSKLFELSYPAKQGRVTAAVRAVVEASLWVASSTVPVTLAVAGILGH